MLPIPGGQVRVYVDGFNLYHGVREAARDSKWLDLMALCRLFLPSTVTGISVRYFTAYAFYRSARSVNRHRTYVAALEATGVTAVTARFKEKELRCHATCGETYTSHEEKETDVNIAVSLVEDALLGLCDSHVLVSGDTDLMPALRAAKRHGRGIYALFPPGRKNDDVAQLCDGYARIRGRHLRKCPLPNPLTARDGSVLRCPKEWLEATP